MECGLLGKKLGHSYSPQIHAFLGDYHYRLMEKQPEELADFLENGSFSGLNVTIPYKKAVIPYLSELSPVAQKLGAVNTIVRRQDGRLIGHNSDYFGFRTMLHSSGLTVAGKKVLVLGSGGASATVCAVLEEQGAQVVVISRRGENHYGNLDRHRDAAVIVNATPVGMYPNCGVSPVDLNLFPRLEGVLDLIYNPARTRLLLDAEDRGLVAVNGLLMLVAQAKESAEWFTGKAIPDAKIGEIYKKLRRQSENLVLIGMPGSGKSTIGQALAQKLGRPFVDADAELEAQARRKIPEIFATEGEPGFRRLETQVLAELGKQSGLVLATGGGCVTRPENEALLRQNGLLICLERGLELLPVAGRPLSQGSDLRQMYQIRKPLYMQFADYSVDNNGNLEDTLSEILRLWEERP